MKQTTKIIAFCGFALVATCAQGANVVAKGLMNDIPLPIARADLESAVSTIFKTIDRNRNHIYDANEQLEDHIQQLAVNTADVNQQMPNCSALGILPKNSQADQMADVKDFTPMVLESVQFLAAKAFTGLDVDNNGILTKGEVDAYVSKTNALAENMDSQCQKFALQSKSGQLPDPNTMLSIMNQLVALNSKFE